MHESSKSEVPVALVTGGSSGIGLSTARLLMTHGYRVMICGRSADRLQQAQEQLAECLSASESAELITDVADLGQPESGPRLIETLLERWGRIDVLVNNAAVAPLAPFPELTEKELDETLAVNLRTPFRMTQLAWEAMAEQRSGTVIHVSSMAAVDPFPGFSLYGASKAWAELLTVALAAEGEPLGMRVCCVRPGAVETPLLRRLFPDFPADQCVTAQEVAELIWACVSQPEQYPSGQAFPVMASSATESS